MGISVIGATGVQEYNFSITTPGVNHSIALPNGTYTLQVSSSSSVTNAMSPVSINSVSTTAGSYTQIFTGTPAIARVDTFADGTWTSRTAGFGAINIASGTFGNNLFVLGGANGTVSTSADGITWTNRSTGLASNQSINGLTFGNGIYVGVTSGSAAINSSNGTTWTIPVGSGLLFNGNGAQSVTFGNGVFVATGNNATISTSTNGTSWTTRSTPLATQALFASTFANGLFIVAGDQGALITSPDGTTWTSRTSSFGASAIRGLTFGNGTYVAVGDADKAATSTDGINWTARTMPASGFSVFTVAFIGGTFVAGGTGGRGLFSYDGATWVMRVIGSANIRTVVGGAGLAVVGNVDGGLVTSPALSAQNAPLLRYTRVQNIQSL